MSDDFGMLEDTMPETKTVPHSPGRPTVVKLIVVATVMNSMILVINVTGFWKDTSMQQKLARDIAGVNTIFTGLATAVEMNSKDERLEQVIRDISDFNETLANLAVSVHANSAADSSIQHKLARDIAGVNATVTGLATAVERNSKDYSMQQKLARDIAGVNATVTVLATAVERNSKDDRLDQVTRNISNINGMLARLAVSVHANSATGNHMMRISLPEIGWICTLYYVMYVLLGKGNEYAISIATI